jgi:hypothetical protein
MAKATVKTVNVVEYCDNEVIAVHSFHDNPQGKKEAEQLFRQVAKENGFKKSDVEIGLEEGSLSHSEGNYQMFLITSQD